MMMKSTKPKITAIYRKHGEIGEGMRDILRGALPISAVLLTILYWLTSEMPLDKFEFTVIQLLVMLVILKAIEK